MCLGSIIFFHIHSTSHDWWRCIMIAICNNLAHSAEFKTQLHRVSITFSSCSNHSFFSSPFPSLSQDTKAYCLCKVFVPPDGKLACVSWLEFIQWTRLTLHNSLWIKIILISSPSHLMAARTIFNVKINYRVNMWKHFFNWSNSFCRSKPDFRWIRVQCAALARQTASLNGATSLILVIREKREIRLVEQFLRCLPTLAASCEVWSLYLTRITLLASFFAAIHTLLAR